LSIVSGCVQRSLSYTTPAQCGNEMCTDKELGAAGPPERAHEEQRARGIDAEPPEAPGPLRGRAAEVDGVGGVGGLEEREVRERGARDPGERAREPGVAPLAARVLELAHDERQAERAGDRILGLDGRVGVAEDDEPG